MRPDGRGFEARAAGCGVCIGEAVIAEQMLADGKTPAEVTMDDGYIGEPTFARAIAIGMGELGTFEDGMLFYPLTPRGREFIDRWLSEMPFDEPEGVD